MIEVTRELIAYAIIGAIIVVGAPVLFRTMQRRRRQKLRRRGIKRYGH